MSDIERFIRFQQSKREMIDAAEEIAETDDAVLIVRHTFDDGTTQVTAYVTAGYTTHDLVGVMGNLQHILFSNS